MSEQAELLLTLLDHAPVRISAVDAGLRYRFVNRTALAFLGLSADQLLGRTLAEVRGEAIAAHYAPLVERLQRGETVRHAGWIDYPTQGRRYVQDLLMPWPVAGQTWMLAFSQDSTLQQQQAELLADQVAALQRAEQLKAAIVDNALAALVTTDALGRIVEFNPAAESMFGWPRGRAIGRSVAEVMIPPRHRQAHEAGMARMAAGGPARVLGRRLEMEALRADGSEFPIEMVLWRTDVGGVSHYTASINDLSERVRAQAVIERQRDALRQSEKLTAMGSLLAGVAHELNNPLAIVMGRASLLEEKTAGTALAEDAGRIREAAERCGRIVRTFLNMARSKPAERAPVSVNELIRAAAELLQYGLRSHGIQLSLQLAPGLPQVQADADQLGQILLNLIVNAQQALAALDSGERRLLIASGLEQRRREREPRVWVRVQDNGAGVPEGLRANIFEPFFTTKPEGLGTGLGLAVSRSLAREHGGELQLESPPEGGACFRLSLPISGEALPETAATAPAPLDSAAKARLLVVDDEDEIAELMRQMLENAGYEVATAESGAVALALLEEARFDAVISDLRMPDLDGAGLHRALKERHPSLARRLLFVTGDTLSPGARSFLAETGCACLDKPFTKADLLVGVAALLA